MAIQLTEAEDYRLNEDPFRAITRKTRWKARWQKLRCQLGKPFRPDRIDPDRPGPANLLLVGVDTLRADHLGCYGYGKPTSPNLDRLASRGTQFSDVTAAAPWTLPSFSSALCGVMPGMHGALLPGEMRNMDSQPPSRLDPEIVTLARHLGRLGYRTAAFYSNQFFAFGLAESFAEHSYHNLPAGDLLDLARDWIRQNADQPFFCFVLLNDPHEPTTPELADLQPFLPELRASGVAVTAEALGRYSRWGQDPGPDLRHASTLADTAVKQALAAKLAVYDGTIHYVDRCLGRLQQTLAGWGLADSTLVSVFSDHGEEFLDHAAWSRQWDHDPRGIHGIGHGHTHFQELLHVPWVSWGPGVPSGERRREAVSLCDLAPTLCQWLGVEPLPLPQAQAGAEFSRHLRGHGQAEPQSPQGPEDRLILAEAIAFGPDLVALRKGRWKMIAHRQGQVLALFDLLGSPEEMIDLAGANPEVVSEMLGYLERWREFTPGSGTGNTGTGSWDDMEDTVRQRLKDLGYSE